MKTILVPYHDAEAARNALNCAILLARRFDSYIEGLLVLNAPGVPLGFFAPGMALPPETMALAAEEWRRFADEARTTFKAQAEGFGLALGELETAAPGVAAGWREVDGREGDVVSKYGRLFDLIVLGRSHDLGGSPSLWRETCEAALFESGRPMLLAPTDAPATLGRNILLAWNASTESARTVAFAMPLLQAAERVEVLTIEGHTVAGPTGAEMATHLARHGILATSRTLSANGRPSGEVILEEAGDLGVDLVLKGAFTRSRLREIVFGGTTQHILDYANVPVLLAH